MILNKPESWPYLFQEHLSYTEQKQLDQDWLTQLSYGQTYLWQALNIYDDFLDNAGQAQQLPIANTNFRNFLEIYYRSNLSTNFYKLFNQLLSDLDQTNRQEVLINHFSIINNQIQGPKCWPDFSNLYSLANKSLILAAPALAILDHLGADPYSQRDQTILKFFRYTLTAKQLSDDAHDWLEDFNNGSLTVVTNRLIQAMQRRHISFNVKKNLILILHIFSEDIALTVSHDIINLCQQARQISHSNQSTDYYGLVIELLTPLEKAAKKAQNFYHLLQ